jgi:hypothetical protein
MNPVAELLADKSQPGNLDVLGSKLTLFSLCSVALWASGARKAIRYLAE